MQVELIWARLKICVVKMAHHGYKQVGMHVLGLESHNKCMLRKEKKHCGANNSISVEAFVDQHPLSQIQWCEIYMTSIQ